MSPSPQYPHRGLDQEKRGAPLLSADAADEEDDVGTDEIAYSIMGFHSIACPVFCAVVLSAASSHFVRTPESAAQAEEALSSYRVFDISDESAEAARNDGAAPAGGGNLLKNLGKGFVNGFVMVSFICTLTYGMVLLYKYNCVKCMKGYMAFSIITSLGIMGMNYVTVFIDRFSLNVDLITLYFCIFNVTFVGPIAIFYGKGIPSFVSNGYLVTLSVLLGWQLDNFDDFTCWALLILLALYDMFAVLSPIGPLKFLLDEMSKEHAEPLPGILYEAEIQGVSKPGKRTKKIKNEGRKNGEDEAEGIPVVSPKSRRKKGGYGPLDMADYDCDSGGSVEMKDFSSPGEEKVEPKSRLEKGGYGPLDRVGNDCDDDGGIEMKDLSSLDGGAFDMFLDIDEGCVNFAAGARERVPGDGRVEAHARIEASPHVSPVDDFPTTEEKDMELLRKLQAEADAERSAEDDDDSSTTIKLGMGDFVFYSVLVSKAGTHSFPAFVSCALVVMFGLGGTLVLLSVYKMALPALPISIFLGTTFYLLTRFAIEPWTRDLLAAPHYV